VATPIINQPQVAILVINGIVQKPVVVNGDIVVRPMIQIGLTFDHRVVDGEGGAKFLATYKELLESYESPF
jgi:pyruvate/2-oxoglutarate dehydrogenase complex dihydrolipoamide acyltransferase (E2) component